MRRLLLLIPFFLSVFNSQVSGQQAPGIPDRLDSLFSAYTEKGIFNGVVLIAQDNEILLEKGYGFANFTWKIKNEPDTKLMLASLSKHFTANCILQLHQEGQISLEDKVSKFLPTFADSSIGDLTVHQLLSHTSGIKRDLFELAEESQVNQIEDDIYNKLKISELLFEPGSKYSYSNAGYFLLAKIAEAVKGMSFGDVLQEMIFEPAGMQNSGFWNKSVVVDQLANGYDVMLNDRINGSSTHPSVAAGASNVYSTVGDIYKYELSYQNELLLNKATQRLMETPVMKSYGYGWNSNQVGKDEDGNPVYMTFHNGDAGGFASQYLRYGPDKFTVILLSNQDRLPRSELFNQIIAVVNEGQVKPIRPNFHDQIYKTAMNESVEAALNKAKELQSQRVRFPNAIRVNFLGNMLLKAGRSEDAKTIHKLNIALHPKNFLGYAALGLILRSEGDVNGARQNYEKILEFDPKNSYAKEFLKDLNE